MLAKPVNAISVRRTIRGAVQFLSLALIAGVAVSSTGCSWFRKGDKTDKDKANAMADLKNDSGPNIGEKLPPPEPGIASPRPVGLRPATALLLIYFDFDRAEIRTDQLERVEQNLRYMKENRDSKVLIEGHCDERGTTEYNFALGERRARAVMDYLLKGGISADRLQTLSKGEEEPIDPGHDEVNWAKNRRCQFKFFD